MAAANLPKLTVVKATYSKNSNNDVSEKVRALMAANGGNLIIAGNADFNNLFGDPEPKADKLFHLVYQYGAYGAQRSMTHAEKHVDIYLPALEIKPGQVLTVHVVKAIGLRDTRTLGKQNPYATLKCGSESFTTKAHEKGGTNADWNQSFIFNLDGKDQFMHVVVLDKETLSDSVIARFDIPLPTLAAAVGEIAYNLVHPNDFKKTAGSIVLKCEFRDPNAPKVPATPTPTAAAPATPTPTSPPVQQQPQVVYVQQPMQPQVVYAQPQPVMYQQPQVVYQQPQPVYQQPQPVYQQPQPQVVYQQPQPTPQPQPAPQPVYVPQPAPQPVYTPPAAAAVSTSSSYDIPGWVFYPGKDINGNDHTNQPQNHGKNKFVIAAHCDQVGAVAFNTNGWVKHAIRGPPFDSFPNAGAGEGLYIKAQYAPASGAGSAAAAAPAYSAPAPSPYDIPGWVFYQGKDSSGNDHPNQPQNHGGNKFVLAAHCDQIGAVCFNTNGWCKTKCVGLPLHGFPNAQAHEGLYVKQGYLPQ